MLPVFWRLGDIMKLTFYLLRGSNNVHEYLLRVGFNTPILVKGRISYLPYLFRGAFLDQVKYLFRVLF